MLQKYIKSNFLAIHASPLWASCSASYVFLWWAGLLDLPILLVIFPGDTSLQPYKDINDLVLAWFESAHAQKLPVSKILEEKIASSATTSNWEIHCRSGWLEKFC